MTSPRNWRYNHYNLIDIDPGTSIPPSTILKMLSQGRIRASAAAEADVSSHVSTQLSPRTFWRRRASLASDSDSSKSSTWRRKTSLQRRWKWMKMGTCLWFSLVLFGPFFLAYNVIGVKAVGQLMAVPDILCSLIFIDYPVKPSWKITAQ